MKAYKSSRTNDFRFASLAAACVLLAGCDSAPKAQAPASAAPVADAPKNPSKPGPTRIAPKRAAAAPAPQPPVRYVEEAPGAATVLTLGAHMCKWPIGDPSSDDFTFCGRRASEGPYCVEHARVAYQPAQAKKRSSANELARSLRRYI